MIPEINFLLLYRCPCDVVDSFSRRGDKAFRSNLGFAVEIWSHYNRLLLDFHDRFPERCLFVNSYWAVQSPILLLEVLSERFGLHLESVAEVYDPSLLHRFGSSRWASLVEHACPEALEVYEQLNLRAAETLANGVCSGRESG